MLNFYIESGPAYYLDLFPIPSMTKVLDISSASGCPLANKNKGRDGDTESLKGYQTGSSPTFGSRLVPQSCPV